MKICETNEAQLFGRMLEEPVYSHSIYEEQFFQTKFGVPRLSGHVDILPTIISASLLSAIPKGEEPFGLRGQLRSYNQAEKSANHLHIRFFAQSLQDELDSLCPRRQNFVFLEGFLCKAPVYRVTPFGREITDMLLAVNRSFKKSDYIPVIAWGKNARFAKNLQVGQKMRIEGRFQSREYEKSLPSGEKITRTAYEVSASSVSIVI